MARIQPRTFLEPGAWLETRAVDLDQADAYLPAGSVLMCWKGHVAALVVNAMHEGQFPQAGDFAPLQIGMKFEAGEAYPLCRCGAALVAFEMHGDLLESLHFNVQGRGWV